MDADQYQKLAVQTLAEPVTEVKQRLIALCIKHDVHAMLEREVEYGFEFDAVKRTVFYGKPAKNKHSLQLCMNIESAERLISAHCVHDTKEHVINAAKFVTDEVANAAHAIIGIKTECSELFEVLLELHGNNHNQKQLRLPFTAEGFTESQRQNIIEEAGDVLWYVAILCHAIGVPMSVVMEANNAKLLKGRFKSGSFNADNAEVRDTKEEMKHLDEAAGLGTLPGKVDSIEDVFLPDEADACYSLMESATESITLTDTLAALLRAEHCTPEVEDILRKIEQNNDDTRNKIRIATEKLA